MSIITTMTETEQNEPQVWFELTDSGLSVNRPPTSEEWQGFGQKLALSSRSMMWAIGDWLLIGEAEGYIERGKLNAACELFGIAHQTAKHAASGCRAFPKRCRQRHLSFGHHKEVANRDDATDLLSWATDNKASVAALREEKKRRDSGDADAAASVPPAVPDGALSPDAKLFRDFLKFADGQRKMTVDEVSNGMGVSEMAARKLVFAATVHPAVDVVCSGRNSGKAFVVDWKEQSASDRIDKLHNKPELKRLDDQLEQVIDSALSLIDGFYHAHRSSFQRIRPKDHRRLMTRSEVLRQRAAEFADDIQTRVPGN